MTYADDDRYLDGPLSRGPIPMEQADREIYELLQRVYETAQPRDRDWCQVHLFLDGECGKPLPCPVHDEVTA